MKKSIDQMVESTFEQDKNKLIQKDIDNFYLFLQAEHNGVSVDYSSENLDIFMKMACSILEDNLSENDYKKVIDNLNKWPGKFDVYLVNESDESFNLTEDKKSFYFDYEISKELIEVNELHDVSPKKVRKTLDPSSEVIKKVLEKIKEDSTREEDDEEMERLKALDILLGIKKGIRFNAEEWNSKIEGFHLLELQENETCEVEESGNGVIRMVVYSENNAVCDIREFRKDL